MKSDLYTKTRTTSEKDPETGKKFKRTKTEHVMSYKVFQVMSVHKILQMIGR